MPPRHSSFHHTNPRTPTLKQATLCWDPNIESYRLSAPFNMDLITFLKTQIPSDKRTWLPDSKEWIFDRTYFDIMEFIVIRMWPGAVILTEADVILSAAEQSRRRSAMSGTQLDSASVTLRFLELTNLKALPQEHREAKRAYIAAITRLHPDKGGDVTKAAELNVCWERLEREAYKK